MNLNEELHLGGVVVFKQIKKWSQHILSFLRISHSLHFFIQTIQQK